MVKFKFVTDEHSLSFVIKDKFSERLLREALKDFSSDEINSIVKIVAGETGEDGVGETEFSEITSVVTIKRILSSKD